MAVVAAETGLPRLGEELSQQVVQRDGSLAPALGVLAGALIVQGKPVAEVHQIARQKLPGSMIFAYLNLREHQLTRDFDAAVTVGRQLLQREPGNDHITYAMSQIEREKGLIQECIDRLDAIWSVPGPYQGAAGNDLAYMLAEHAPDRLGESYLIAGKVLRVAPDSPALLDTMGWIELKKGNPQVAQNYFNRAVVGLPQHPEVHYHLALAYEQTGNRDWALMHLRRAKAGELSPTLAAAVEAALVRVSKMPAPPSRSIAPAAVPVPTPAPAPSPASTPQPQSPQPQSKAGKPEAASTATP